MRKYILKTASYLLATTLAVSVAGTISMDGSATEKYKKVSKKHYKIEKDKLVNKKSKEQLKGFLEFDGRLYKNARLFTGLADGVYYKKGEKGTGDFGKYYYKDGMKFTGSLKSFVYNNGVKASGIIDGKLYKNGRLATGLVNAKKLYVKGVLSKGAFYFKGTWYLDAIVDTKKMTAIKEYENARKIAVKNDYTVESWNAFLKVLNENQLKMTATENTTEIYAAATVAITKAKNQLVISPAMAVIKAINALHDDSSLEEILAVEKLYNNLSEAERLKISEYTLAVLIEFKEFALEDDDSDDDGDYGDYEDDDDDSGDYEDEDDFGDYEDED